MEICENGPEQLKVGDSIQERRVDKYLHGRFSNYSRVMIQELIKAGGVSVNGQVIKQSFKLSPGDIIELTLPEIPKYEIVPQDIPLNIIYEDDDIIVLNKQPNIIVHPARGYKSGTLVNALAHHCSDLSSGLGELRPGIVHRLDRNTTGVIVATKNDEAQWKVATQFQDRKTEKNYIAIVHGCPELTRDRIKAPLGIDPRSREKYAVRHDIGKESITDYEVLEEFKGYALVKLVLHTGRTHQIRVHLSHIKHPVVADDMYGGKVVYPWQIKNKEQVIEEPIMGRVALHAWKLGFFHPRTNEWVQFEADLPSDMQNFLDMLREYRKPQMVSPEEASQGPHQSQQPLKRPPHK